MSHPTPRLGERLRRHPESRTGIDHGERQRQGRDIEARNNESKELEAVYRLKEQSLKEACARLTDEKKSLHSRIDSQVFEINQWKSRYESEEQAKQLEEMKNKLMEEKLRQVLAQCENEKRVAQENHTKEFNSLFAEQANRRPLRPNDQAQEISRLLGFITTLEEQLAEAQQREVQLLSRGRGGTDLPGSEEALKLHNQHLEYIKKLKDDHQSEIERLRQGHAKASRRGHVHFEDGVKWNDFETGGNESDGGGGEGQDTGKRKSEVAKLAAECQEQRKKAEQEHERAQKLEQELDELRKLKEEKNGLENRLVRLQERQLVEQEEHKQMVARHGQLTMERDRLEAERNLLLTEKAQPEVATAQSTIHDGDSELHELVEKLRDQADCERRKAEELKKDVENVAAENMRTKESSSKLQKAYEDLINTEASIRKDHEGCRALLEEAQSERADLRLKYDTANHEVVKLRREVSMLQKQISGHEKTQSEWEAVRLKHSSAEEELSRLHKYISTIQGQLQDQEKAQLEWEAQQNSARGELSRLQNECEKRLRDQEQKAHSELEELRVELDSAKQEVSRLQTEVSRLQEQLRDQEEAQSEREATHLELDAAKREAATLQTEMSRLQVELLDQQEELQSEGEALRMENDLEMGRLRNELSTLRRQLSHQGRSSSVTASPSTDPKESDRLQRDCRILTQKVKLLERENEDRNEEVLRLQRESSIFLKPLDNIAGDQVAGSLRQVNEELNRLAQIISDRWENEDGAGKLGGNIKGWELQQAREGFETSLGRPLAELLSSYRSDPVNENNDILVLFALQASAVHSITDILRAFCAGLTAAENGILQRIYKQMCQSQSHSLAARWRALGHNFARLTIPNYEAALGNLILKTLVERFSAVGVLIGRKHDPPDLREDYEGELGRIVNAVLRLLFLIKERTMCSNYEVYCAQPGEGFDATLMDDVLEECCAGVEKGSVLCTVEIGLVKNGHTVPNGQDEFRNREVCVKAKAVTQELIVAYLR